jgi:broad specificity phosphatase PhoE
MFSHLPPLIVYTRHPQCVHNLGIAEYTRLVQSGASNKASALTDRGLKQAVYTAEYLKRVFGTFDLTFASDFTRTHAIPLELGSDFVIDTRIGERWHGQLHEQGNPFFEKFPEERELWKADYYNYKAPGGESCPEVEARISDFLLDRKLFADARSMLVSSHGISGLCFRKVLLEASVEDWHNWHQSKVDRLGNASVTVYKRLPDGKYEIIIYNHLPWTEYLDEEAEGTEA